MYSINVIMKKLPIKIHEELRDILRESSYEYTGLFIEDVCNNYDKGHSFINIMISAQRPAEAYEDVVYFLDNLDLFGYVYSVELDK